ncbi:MAG: hypothetical protein Tsb0020_22140 [Haliangiales bacterium]
MTGASIYSRRGSIFVGTMSRTDTGLFRAEGDYITLPSDSPLETIAAEMLTALSRSRRISVSPASASPGGPDTSLLHAAGVKSQRTFAQGAKLVSVRADDENLRFYPSTQTNSHFNFSAKNIIQLSKSASLSQIGAAIEQAFSLCK